MKPLSPYSLTHKLRRDDNRIAEHKKQFKERGFDDTECWNLDQTIAKFIAPRLRHFKEHTHGYPPNITHEDWDNILELMCRAFELEVEKAYELDWSDEELTISHDGMKLFAEYFGHLWD